ncbi:MAG: ferritin-like domain-containing protein [Rhodospirillaceae bacterium]|nr:ferritin-like domain-containing protein [Rhodospirillaceae bacterium]MBT6429555.1 ferritin-like domain-containing protein [Rhodospirillaceae bacterium]MBT7760661.1 ferritin-like domain-containing protein [Rhodospirillaceae bacterium]
MSPNSLSEAACAILQTADPAAKAAAGTELAAAWRRGDIATVGTAHPPIRPARPSRPELRRPGDMPRRGTSGTRGRIALLHAVAHIELNAIDLAWDLIARFAHDDLPRAFYDEWVSVAADEGRHFTLLAARLAELGTTYGDLPAHDGLWQAAVDTADDLTARLAVVPMLLEARGLDVTPAMVGKLLRGGDQKSSEILQLILDEEISHVAIGCRWFEWSCQRLDLEPVDHWRALIAKSFASVLKPPFNEMARNRAGMAAKYYQPLDAPG